MTKKFNMEREDQVEAFVTTGSMQEEATTRMTFEIPESLKVRFDIEAARRRLKKRERLEDGSSRGSTRRSGDWPAGAEPPP